MVEPNDRQFADPYSNYLGVTLRVGLSAHTAQALATGRYPRQSLTQKLEP